MTSRLGWLGTIALASAVFLSGPATAEMTGAQKQEVEQIIEDYLVKNPEVIERALIALEEKRNQQRLADQSTAIQSMKAAIFNSDHQVVLGNPDGKVTLVEFFDYNCGYCRRALADMVALMETNPDLRVVLKEFPILSEGSMEAAQIAIAVGKIAPDSYMEFHNDMFTLPGPANKSKALSITDGLGLDRDAVLEMASSQSTRDNLSEVRGLAEALGISGTPSYVIGDEAVFGAVGYDQLLAKIQGVQNCETVTC